MKKTGYTPKEALTRKVRFGVFYGPGKESEMLGFRISRIVYAVILFLALFYGEVIAESDDVGLERIVVTPYRYAEDIFNAPVSTLKITQKDIKNSNAQKVIDLLRPATGLVVRDWYGTGAKSSVDIRGFGEQAALNLLVLVDGRRANQIDLSGIDWAQIPLDQVESIEIIRGGSGCVLYGENAVSGVINILTKTVKGKPEFGLNTKYGSYDMNSQSLYSRGAQDKLLYLFQIGREGTHGYRKNSFYKAQDFLLKLGYDINNKLYLGFNSGYRDSSYGLPASLYQSHINTHSRRYAKNADDHARDKDYYFTFKGKSDFQGMGELDMDLSFRRKSVVSYFLTSGLNTAKSRIDTFGITPKHTFNIGILGHSNKIITGIDFYRSDFSLDSHDKNTDGLKNFTDINKNSLAGYFQDEFFITRDLILVGGYRYESTGFDFDYHDNDNLNPDIDKDIRLNKKAFNAGAVYNFQKDSSIFFNINRSFRFPAVDEFTYIDANWQQQLNTGLKPQISTNYELGIKYLILNNLMLNLSLYRMNLKNELYFNYTGGPLGFGQNENYDQTYHEGIDFAFDAKLNNYIKFFGNYSFIKTVFNRGQYGGNYIPMIPRHKSNIGINLMVFKNFNLNILTNYIGKRYFLNDQSNSVSRLNGYITTDANIAYAFQALTVVFGINNIFNRQYCEYAGYSSFTNDKFYYPSPTRNFNLKIEYKF